jgi:hypothetical protein
MAGFGGAGGTQNHQQQRLIKSLSLNCVIFRSRPDDEK